MSAYQSARAAVAALSCLVLVAGALAFAHEAGAQAKGNPTAGKPLYTQKCVACHKADGSGGVKLTGNPTPSWKDAKRMAKVTDAQLRECIVNGVPKSGMVAWGKTGQLKPQQIEDVIAYIRTLPKK
jgi:mono/diheme cytochrome c family protein